MRTDRMRRLSDRLAGAESVSSSAILDEGYMIHGRPDRFSMDVWAGTWHDGSGHPCGTVGCIAGYAADMAVHEDGFAPRPLGEEDIEALAIEWLGLSADQASELFGCGVAAADSATGDVAARVVRMVADGMSPLDAWRVAGDM